MKTILIPTDFHETSVQLSENILKSFKNEPVKLIFFHAYKLTDSISDLLMLSRRSAEYGQIPESFYKACYNLREKYKEEITQIGIENFYGSTMASFRNFAEANEVDFFHHPEPYNFWKISKYSIDPTLFLAKSGIPRLKVTQPEEVQTKPKTATTKPVIAQLV